MIVKISFFKRTDIRHLLPAIVFINDEDIEGITFYFLCFGVGIYTLYSNQEKQ